MTFLVFVLPTKKIVKEQKFLIWTHSSSSSSFLAHNFYGLVKDKRGKSCWEPWEQVVFTMHLALLAPFLLGPSSLHRAGHFQSHTLALSVALSWWAFSPLSMTFGIYLCPQLWIEQTGRISWHNLYQKQLDLSYLEPTTRANRMAHVQVCCMVTDEKGIISGEIQPSTMRMGDRSPLARGADYIPALPWLTALKKSWQSTLGKIPCNSKAGTSWNWWSHIPRKTSNEPNPKQHRPQKRK